MELIFKIIYVILAVITLITVYLIAAKFARIMNTKILFNRDIEMNKLKFSELEILAHLDFIIEECLDYYIAINLTPKQLYYISNNIEKEIIDYLGEVVPSRISPTLYSQLSLVYDSSQVGTVIGEKIYTKVLEYVIQFNVQNDSQQKNKMPR